MTAEKLYQVWQEELAHDAALLVIPTWDMAYPVEQAFYVRVAKRLSEEA